MRVFTLSIGLAALELSAALQLRAVKNPRVLHYEAIRDMPSYTPNSKSLDVLDKRDGNSSLPSLPLYPDSSAKVRMVLNVTAGTPPQSFGAILDTGSSDFIIRTPQSAICAAGNCTAYGSFDPTKSSTFVSQKLPFHQSFGEGTTANGTLGTDTVNFGGVTIKNLVIAPADASTISDNVWGMGFKREETRSASNIGQPYQNGVLAMKDAGLIKAAAYSVWLNDINAPNGNVLFGGVDTAKYQGTLQTVPVVPQGYENNTAVYGFVSVSLDAIGTSHGATTTITTQSGFPITVLLDTGTTQMQLPLQIISNLCSAFGCTNQTGNYLLPCSMQGPGNGNISFAFSGVNITVPVGQMIRNNGWTGGLCQFDIGVASDPTSYILGDSFLRGAYVVYDIEAATISLASTVFNSTESNIVEIQPGFQGVPSANNATGVRTGIPTATGLFQPAVTANGAGKGMGVAAAAIGVAALAFCWGI